MYRFSENKNVSRAELQLFFFNDLFQKSNHSTQKKNCDPKLKDNQKISAIKKIEHHIKYCGKATFFLKITLNSLYTSIFSLLII